MKAHEMHEPRTIGEVVEALHGAMENVMETGWDRFIDEDEADLSSGDAYELQHALEEAHRLAVRLVGLLSARDYATEEAELDAQQALEDEEAEG